MARCASAERTNACSVLAARSMQYANRGSVQACEKMHRQDHMKRKSHKGWTFQVSVPIRSARSQASFWRAIRARQALCSAIAAANRRRRAVEDGADTVLFTIRSNKKFHTNQHRNVGMPANAKCLEVFAVMPED